MKLIAEIGWNHMGNMSLAQHMIAEAAKAGATHVKFQTWQVQNLKSGPWDSDGRREIYAQAELSEDDHRTLKAYCDSNNVTFLTSCFASDTVEFISKISNEIKVPSTELTNISLIDNIIDKFGAKPLHHVYVSTGAHLHDEVKQVALKLSDNNIMFTLLHCVSCYPVQPKMCNLSTIDELRHISRAGVWGNFEFDVGYSGHFDGIDDAIIAVCLGATVIEKHFTIDKTLPGRDNKFALLPEDFKRLSTFVINHRRMMKECDDLQKCEEAARNIYRGRWNTGDEYLNK